MKFQQISRATNYGRSSLNRADKTAWLYLTASIRAVFSVTIPIAHFVLSRMVGNAAVSHLIPRWFNFFSSLKSPSFDQPHPCDPILAIFAREPFPAWSLFHTSCPPLSVVMKTFQHFKIISPAQCNIMHQTPYDSGFEHRYYTRLWL